MMTLEQIKTLNEKTLAAWEKSSAYKSKAQRALADKYRGGKTVTKWEIINGEVRCLHMGLCRNWQKYTRTPYGGLKETAYFECE